MLVVDASCLYEVITEGPSAHHTRAILATSEELAAPALIDVEVLALIRRDALLSVIESSRADIAVGELQDWCGERFGMLALTERVWQLRGNVRTWDGYYVALAEYLDAPLVTLDRRLAAADGPRCSFVIPGESSP